MATVQHPAFKHLQVVDDPAPWVEQGYVLLDDQEAAALDANAPVVPAGNASREVWLAYALAQPNADEAFFTDLSRDEIRDLFV